MEGNERADRLAKEAALKLKKKPDYDQCPVSFVKRSIRMATLVEWNRRYKSGETASVTKMFFPNAVAAYRIVRKMETTSVITQIFTGHGGFSAYLNRFKCKDNPSYLCEPGVDETVPHLLLECPVFARDQFEIEQILNTTMVARNLPELIKRKDNELFIKYCLKIANRILNRNK